MPTKARLIRNGAWAGSAGAITGDNVVSGITALAGGLNNTFTPVLNGDINLVATVATALDSVRLPPASAGDEVWVRNGGAAILAVYPPIGGRINILLIDRSVAVSPGDSMAFKAIGTLDWVTPKSL